VNKVVGVALDIIAGDVGAACLDRRPGKVVEILGVNVGSDDLPCRPDPFGEPTCS